MNMCFPATGMFCGVLYIYRTVMLIVIAAAAAATAALKQ